MNCAESLERLQQWLDGDSTADEPAWLRHIDHCVECRDARRAAGLLRELRLIPQPEPTLLLANRLTAAVLADIRMRRMVRRRKIFLTCAVAAAAVIALVLSLPRHSVAPRNPEVAEVPVTSHPTPEVAGSLNDSMAEAQTAVVSLTRRTADDAVGTSRFLFAIPPVSSPALNEAALEPPTKSLRGAGESMATGLEPVASSARRALDLFLRDLSPSPSRPSPPTQGKS